MRKPLCAVLVSLCAGLFAPADTLAQSTFYLRLLPEVAVTSVMHTKKVTSGAGSSSSESSTVRPEGGINFYLGYLRPPGAGWVIGGEFRGTIALREDIDGVTPTGGSGTHAVWPGPWEFTNRVGLGLNLILGRELGSMNSRGYLFGGLARWNSDFRSAGADPASEESIEDQQVITRWPLTGGSASPCRSKGRWTSDCATIARRRVGVPATTSTGKFWSSTIPSLYKAWPSRWGWERGEPRHD